MKDYSVEELKELSLYEFCQLFWGCGSRDYNNRVSSVTELSCSSLKHSPHNSRKHYHLYDMCYYVALGEVHKDNVEELCNFIENLPDVIVDKIFEDIRQGGSQWSKSLSGK